MLRCTARRALLAPQMTHDFVLQPPRNLGLIVVPQGLEMVVERLGKFHCVLQPGVSFLVPWVDRVRYVYSTKEQGISLPHQSSITKDNVVVNIDGVLFVKIVDPQRASYSCENALLQITQLAQTAMRSAIGKMSLDRLFEERVLLNATIVDSIATEAENWGVLLKRYEVRDIAVSEQVRASMDLQAEAERKKRKAVLESEGEMEARVNAAKGERLAQEELALASKFAQVAAAEAGAESLGKSTTAVVESIRQLSAAIDAGGKGARDAVAFRLAEQYIEAFSHMAKTNNTVLLSAPVGDPTSVVANAMGVFGALQQRLAATADGGASAPATGAASSAVASAGKAH
jgi:regulator of protease activity HflC (stomatin/prohibitin superfamily)